MAIDPPWSRRIVICCDGTWQSSVSGADNVPSNVTKLCRHIARIGTDRNNPNKKFHQLVYYDSGVGTGNLSKREQRRQGGTGAGLAENVIEAYNFIVLNYEPGDEIFCFGFSRGAYTARAVAGLVTDIGVIKPHDMQIFPQLYRAYRMNDEGLAFRETQAWSDFVHGKLSPRGLELEEKGFKRSKWGDKEKAEGFEINPHEHFKEISEDSRKVKVVGVWDTVGSLGVPDIGWFDFSRYRTKYGFHNVKLSENIEHAFHALALDERRQAFRPTIWCIPQDMKKKLAEDGKAIPELKQVWFPGVHINCGGGSDDAIGDMHGDLENLSYATFTWMLTCIDPYLTIDRGAFKATMKQYQRWLMSIRYACTYHKTTPTDTAMSWIPYIPFINPGRDELSPPRRDPVHTHQFNYGWGTGNIVDSYTGMYRWFTYPAERVPGHCTIESFDEKKVKYETNEYIHPICHYRDLVRGPEPRSMLRDFTRTHKVTKGTKGRYWWTHKTDDKPLPEWVILKGSGDEFNFEREWYKACERTEEDVVKLADEDRGGYKGDFLKAVDEKNDFRVGDKEGWEYP
ncbi:hypothetical protein EJ04DRAFT_78019 [Polyplosphaeria fusca]|uniref:T6SS Phospholipase effector Tle1-like catalytic domain-containing protein n=1 Tax=Polyplosphaeria fusca TaxID=682080 RepID=A0A9P4QP21_9PLEO|nr:hypothetical protein EJ04DRAFT_78019 [Polyplosphaeria fusca]